MSFVSFYRKWRPQTFEEVIGQERVTRTLQNALRTNRIVHAYLFAGYRGTGKTTTARLLAKALNCVQGPTPTPCNACPSCQAIGGGYSLDVIEIDAASNRGIDEIRELRERVRLAPAEGRYKVYIIDEAHMMTTEAFNALLKTLEEPPAHAVFILVTTEAHRLPPTILSRTQRFDFRRVPTKEIVRRLQRIAREEGLAVDEDALLLIARSGDGSVRDAESILDQLATFAESRISRKDVVALLGLVEEEIANQATEVVISQDPIQALRLASAIIDEGKEVRQVLRFLIEHFRDLLIVKTCPDPTELIDRQETHMATLRDQADRLTLDQILRTIKVLASSESESRFHPQLRLLLEMALLRMAGLEHDLSLADLARRLEALEQRVLGREGPSPAPPAATEGTSPNRGGQQSRPSTGDASFDRSHRISSGRLLKRAQIRREDGERKETPKSTPHRNNQERASGDGEMAVRCTGDDQTIYQEVTRNWTSILEAIKRKKLFCHALLIDAELLGVENGTVIVGLPPGYNFHAENLQREENRMVVEEAIAQVVGRPLRFRCLITELVTPGAASTTHQELDPLVSKAVELFGGRIVETRKYQEPKESE